MNEEIKWSEEAKATLDKVPPFAKDMAKDMIEDFARDEGVSEIDAELMKRARAKFGM